MLSSFKENRFHCSSTELVSPESSGACNASATSVVSPEASGAANAPATSDSARLSLQVPRMLDLNK